MTGGSQVDPPSPEKLREIADRMSDSYAEMSDVHIEWLRAWADDIETGARSAVVRPTRGQIIETLEPVVRGKQVGLTEWQREWLERMADALLAEFWPGTPEEGNTP